jgi:hypothetical protein
MSLESIIQEEARLIILRELFAQPNRSATSTSIRNHLLAAFMINKSREWVEDQFDWLAERAAVKVVAAGSVKIATLAPRGREHLAHQAFISGVLSPTDPVL